MVKTDGIKIKGSFELIHFDKDGNIKDRRYIDNLVVNTGLAFLAGALSGDETGTNLTYIGIGTSNTAATATDTTLGVEVETRVNGTPSRVTTTATNDTYQVVGSITATGSRAVVEAGLFDAVSSGTMVSRQVFAAVNLATDDSIQITWKLAFASA